MKKVKFTDDSQLDFFLSLTEGIPKGTLASIELGLTVRLAIKSQAEQAKTIGGWTFSELHHGCLLEVAMKLVNFSSALALATPETLEG